MIMEEVFDKLKSLQDVLSRKYAIETEIQEAPRALSTKEELLSRLKKSYIDKHALYEDSQARIADLKTKMAEAEKAREDAEKLMDSISTQREYETLDKQIREASDKEQQLRKDLQKEEKIFVEMDETLKRDEEMIKEQEDELKQEQSHIDQEISGKRKELKECESQEKNLIPGLEEDIVFKFERIIKSKQGLGIVPVINSVCTGCHMVLPAQFVNEVHEGQKIVFCPYCSRILFYQDTENDSSYFTEVDAGSLSDLEDYEDEGDEDSEFEDDESEEIEKEPLRNFEEE
jgi:uncharacterized protein